LLDHPSPKPGHCCLAILKIYNHALFSNRVFSAVAAPSADIVKPGKKIAVIDDSFG
jgi:hypothetical protein